MTGDRASNWTHWVRGGCYAAAMAAYGPSAYAAICALADGSAWTGTLSVDRSVLVLGINAFLYLGLGCILLFLGQCSAWAIVRARRRKKMPRANGGPGKAIWAVYGCCCAAFLACVTARNALLCAAAFAGWDSPAGPLVVILVGPLMAMIGILAIAAAMGACVLGTGALYLFIRMGRQMDLAGAAPDTEERNGQEGL